MLATLPSLGCGGSQGTAAGPAPSGGTSTAITAQDLRQRLFAYAADSMMGREAGTTGNYMATTYIADQVRRMGLTPAGENGTYFQEVPLTKVDIAPGTSLSAGGRTFTLWEEYFPLAPGFGLPIGRTGTIAGVPVVYGGQVADTANLISPADANGKVVVLAAQHAPNGERRFSVSRGTMQALAGASAVIMANLDVMPPNFRGFLQTPRTSLKGDDAEQGPTGPLLIFVTPSVAEAIMGGPLEGLAPGTAGTAMGGSIGFVDGPPEAAARNVVAILPGSDPALKGEYVAIGAHNDHIGMGKPVDHDSMRAYLGIMQPGGAEDQPKQPDAEQAAKIQKSLDSLRALRGPRLDSIYNGADDDGSGTVTVLEIAQAFSGAKDRPKRSLLFVWHTGEEKGLWGSAYYTDHPTVPRDSIVAQLNMDMVGRGNPEDVPNGGPGYVQLIGSRRLSTELGDMVEEVNTSGSFGFSFDYQYDADGHPSNYYCRSDHYMYARYGIPIVFFTTGTHRDYHQVTDEPQYINYDKMARIGRFVHDMAAQVANLDHRVVVDKPKPDPKGQCKQ